MAWTDSYFEGRKSPWSDSVVSLGEKAMMRTAATSQATIVHHGCLTTKRASRANMGASLSHCRRDTCKTVENRWVVGVTPSAEMAADTCGGAPPPLGGPGSG